MQGSEAKGSAAGAVSRQPIGLLIGAAALTVALAAASPLTAREDKPIAWDRIAAEGADLLARYIRINTTNPPGNELPAAQLLKEKFLAEGIPVVVFEAAPGRALLVARLRGTGKRKKAIILLNHMDVVPAEAKDWQVDPFSGTIKDGEVWGRGALDDKGPGVAQLMAMVAVKRAGILLDRDVVFVATGDEETGGKLGAGWLVEHQPDLVADAGFALNEGGEIRLEPDGRKFYAVSVAEKSPLWIRLSTTGSGGHGAAPAEQTAVTRLIRALAKLVGYQPPLRVGPLVEQEFRLRGVLDRRPPASRGLRKALKDPAFAKQFLSVPSQAAMVRDTVAPTVLAAGQRTNVIPSEAYAEVDCRLLPDEDPKSFLQIVREVIGDDAVKIEAILSMPALASPESSELMTAIKTLARREDGKAPAIPTLTLGFTDSHYLRRLGIVVYGLTPLEMSPDQAHTIHGANERVSINNLRGAIERIAMLLKIMGNR